MASQGPYGGGTIVIDNSIGQCTWETENIQRILIDDEYSCTINAQSTNTSTFYLKVTNFGFSIPEGSNIDGIKVEVKLDRYNFRHHQMQKIML